MEDQTKQDSQNAQTEKKINDTTQKWRCPNCGYVYQGEEPPARCPVCAAPGDDFEEVSYDAVSYDYEPIILDVCCSSVSDQVQEANMADMERIGMKVVRSNSANEIVAELFD